MHQREQTCEISDDSETVNKTINIHNSTSELRIIYLLFHWLCQISAYLYPVQQINWLIDRDGCLSWQFEYHQTSTTQQNWSPFGWNVYWQLVCFYILWSDSKTIRHDYCYHTTATFSVYLTRQFLGWVTKNWTFGNWCSTMFYRTDATINYRNTDTTTCTPEWISKHLFTNFTLLRGTI